MMAITYTRFLILSIIAVILGLTSYMMSPALVTPLTDIRIEPQHGTITTDETFTIDIVVSSEQPVNVFQGMVVFNPNVVSISKIDYNTSIADLWAERPWYSNGDGTLNFAGGTTEPGGFTGTGSIIKITFTPKQTGEAVISLAEARILKHNGLGTDARLGMTIDAVFDVTEEQLQNETIVQKSGTGQKFTVMQAPPNTDLNGDGQQNFFDISIFMSDLTTQNMKSDFNRDGVVNLADLSILNNS